VTLDVDDSIADESYTKLPGPSNVSLAIIDVEQTRNLHAWISYTLVPQLESASYEAKNGAIAFLEILVGL